MRIETLDIIELVIFERIFSFRNKVISNKKIIKGIGIQYNISNYDFNNKHMKALVQLNIK